MARLGRCLQCNAEIEIGDCGYKCPYCGFKEV